MQAVRRGMSDQDLVSERCRLEGLNEMSRCEEVRFEIVQDELDRRSRRPFHVVTCRSGLAFPFALCYCDDKSLI